MKRYLIRVRPLNGPAFHYTGIFAHAVDAVTHAMEITGGTGRISARVLP